MSAFKEAFAKARKSGKAEFEWEGKKYNTKVKAEAAKPSVKPKARPTAPLDSAKPKARAANLRSSEGTAKPGGKAMLTEDNRKAIAKGKEKNLKIAKANAKK